MKTALVTFYHIHHYGAQFQAAATVRAVESLGSQCEIIDYYVNQNNALYRRPTSPSRPALRRPYHAASPGAADPV